MVREKFCVLRVIISIVYDHNNKNNVCQASTLSSEEITKTKRVFVLNSKTWNVELSAFAKERLLELSAFAIKQTFNM